LGVADRVASRCRDLLGKDAVVDAARLNLARAADCLLFVRCDGHERRVPGVQDVELLRNSKKEDENRGVFQTARSLAGDPYMLSTLKRAYCVSVDGIDDDAKLGAGFFTVARDSRETLLAALREEIPKLLTRVSGLAGVSPPSAAAIKVKARCFPRWASSATHAALDAAGDGHPLDRSWEPTALNANATHILDVVCSRNRAFVTAWPAAATEKANDSIASIGHHARFAGVASHETSAVSPYPALPPRGVATLEYVVARHCERVKAARAEKKPMSRAYFKIEEATFRADIPISMDWKCVDVGAAPGGWTQWISQRLDCLRRVSEGVRERSERDPGSAAGGIGRSPGKVWAVDPGRLELFPLPANVTHVQLKAELAIREGRVPTHGVSLLVCDANASPESVTDILLSAKASLRKDGTAYLVTTFKNFCRGYPEWRRQMNASRARFKREGFEEHAFFHSFANCAQEFTYVARYVPVS
jgi:hypothetical protein